MTQISAKKVIQHVEGVYAEQNLHVWYAVEYEHETTLEKSDECHGQAMRHEIPQRVLAEQCHGRQHFRRMMQRMNRPEHV